jgi:hypothetical protein
MDKKIEVPVWEGWTVYKVRMARTNISSVQVI